VERFDLSVRRELLDDHSPFASPAHAQAAINAFRHDQNTDRPPNPLLRSLPQSARVRPARHPRRHVSCCACSHARPAETRSSLPSNGSTSASSTLDAADR
jgi:hypothetical protein